MKKLLTAYPEILVEKYLGSITGVREFTVAMIGNGSDILIMPAGITLKIPKKVRIITTHDKDEHNTQAAPVSDLALRERIIRFAEMAFEVAGVHDYARCDLLLAEGFSNLSVPTEIEKMLSADVIEKLETNR